MKTTLKSVSLFSDPKSRSCLCLLFVIAALFCGIYFVGSAWLGETYFKLSTRLRLNDTQLYPDLDKCKLSPAPSIQPPNYTTKENAQLEDKCKETCIPDGSEALPRGIVSKTSNLEMQPLGGPVSEDNKSKLTKNLLAIAVGIKQKALVNQMVKKFLAGDFSVMLFHYDGVVNEWNDFEWSDKVVHVSARNQTKWWFAKRFLHPDIVADYDYIFLWDEDLGVENFNPGRYLSIVKEEGLEISQPGLDSSKSEVHHHITVRRNRSRMHRRYYNFRGRAKCDANSTAPPCVGWVEMMAPVFSRASWRCVWYMIQNDLIHAWGLDMQLGYCAQGDRTVKVGVVDEEYIVHFGLPTLGGHSDKNKASSGGNRFAVRLRSIAEMKIFKKRWNKAVKEDECWVDPFEGKIN
ncbi:hypothetical protein ACJIZ3_001040 [Penstemon smallii]|uniref:Uncharacterized protein n=1 Tax=Penstemon smallii TaxID=265156 RepID=A0ABD3U5I2_9LAMI